MATVQYNTPGVYINELNGFPNSIVGVATAVPLFIGYTEFAGDPVAKTPLYNLPVQLSSMADFTSHFGGAAPVQYQLVSANGGAGDFTAQVNEGGAIVSRPFDVVRRGVAPAFNLYWQIRLFFANGGGDCYVVSAGSYWTGQSPVTAPGDNAAGWLMRDLAATELLDALNAGGYAKGPTMIVVPEACMLDQADYADVVQAMLAQASSLQDRMAIFDLPGCLAADTLEALQLCQRNFGDAVAPQIAGASYGAAYAPALDTTIVARGDLLFTALAGTDNQLINMILTTQAVQLYTGLQLATIQAAIAAAFPLAAATANDSRYSGDASAYPPPADPPGTAAWRAALTNLLLNALPIYGAINDLVATRIDLQPPSGLMAGVWSKCDAMSGAWNAPANIALASVEKPLVALSDKDQAGFNVPVDGKAIDILRMQPGRGTVVWGARTLDGNSGDYRYIQVRRTLIYIEESIKLALQAYVLAANDGMTWATVIASVSGFLTGLWQQGGLIGAKPSDAYTVRCGLGSTMTAQDVLNGYMIVAVTVQMIHPAEFIELTFTQTMGS